jgi:hypothetical protein
MIVWGGNDGMFQYLNSGASYDPATDTWSSIDTAGAPQARSDAMVVWTGSEMIVWGGVGHALPIRMLADGARYSPATNRWTPVATRGAPSARALSATAWTGNRMMVWGGANTASVDIPALKDLDRRAEFSDTGALYDPVADAWTPMPRAGAPSPRAHAPAVWSGSELIVWGGYDGTPLGDGARFDPLSGTWRPVGSGCAPLPRFGHQAVWTGARMVVWGGGRGADRLYQIGGVYDAATDSWQPMRGGASLPAQFPSAVWSGTEVLMYGSGRYRP